jgi:hypothetical protein
MTRSLGDFYAHHYGVTHEPEVLTLSAAQARCHHLHEPLPPPALSHTPLLAAHSPPCDVIVAVARASLTRATAHLGL